MTFCRKRYAYACIGESEIAINHWNRVFGVYNCSVPTKCSSVFCRVRWSKETQTELELEFHLLFTSTECILFGSSFMCIIIKVIAFRWISMSKTLVINHFECPFDANSIETKFTHRIPNISQHLFRSSRLSLFHHTGKYKLHLIYTRVEWYLSCSTWPSSVHMS